MANVSDKSILTAAGKALLAQLNAEEKALVIDKMIFANVPNRPEYPQPDDVVPTDNVVHQAAVEQRGRLSENSVIYSTTLASDEGPFEFNWTGAYCSEYGVLVTIDHHSLTPKTVDEPGVSGNTLVRSVVLEYKDIAEITNITVDASTWQYNANPRMKKMDDDVAQANIDQNGKDWFIEEGFLVTPQASAFSIKAGAGYVSGNRVALDFDRSIQVPNKPSFIYIDAHREGTPTGEQVTLFNFVVSAEEKDDYIDSSTGKDVAHFICKIAQMLGDSSVSDLRPKGELKIIEGNLIDTRIRTKKVEGLHEAMLNRVGEKKNNMYWGGTGVNILGDSISHGAYSRDIHQNNWTTLLTRMLNAEFNSSNYGFVSLSDTLGSGELLSKAIHKVEKIGDWASLSRESTTHLISGFAYKSVSAGNRIKIQVPYFQRYFGIFYNRVEGGGKVNVKVDGNLKGTIDTNSNGGSVGGYFLAAFDFKGNNRTGNVEIEIETLDSGIVELMGVGYYNQKPADDGFQVNNFSQSGRCLRWTDEDVIRRAISGTTSFILALGHNDAGSAESDDEYFDEFKKRTAWIEQYAKQYGTKVYIIDTVWYKDENSRVRGELVKLGTSIPGASYLPLPDWFHLDNRLCSGRELIDDFKLFDDGSHPNIYGHKLIAEMVAKKMNLSVTSKYVALKQYDWWTPIHLSDASKLKNVYDSSDLCLAWRRCGNSISFRGMIQHDDATGVNAPFPAGSYTLLERFPDNVWFPMTSAYPISVRDNGEDLELGIPAYAGTLSVKQGNAGLRLTAFTSKTNAMSFQLVVPTDHFDDDFIG